MDGGIDIVVESSYRWYSYRRQLAVDAWLRATSRRDCSSPNMIRFVFSPAEYVRIAYLAATPSIPAATGVRDRVHASTTGRR